MRCERGCGCPFLFTLLAFEMESLELHSNRGNWIGDESPEKMAAASRNILKPKNNFSCKDTFTVVWDLGRVGWKLVMSISGRMGCQCYFKT